MNNITNIFLIERKDEYESREEGQGAVTILW